MAPHKVTGINSGRTYLTQNIYFFTFYIIYLIYNSMDEEPCCTEYKFCKEHGFIMFDEGYSNQLIIKFYNPKEKLPMNHYAAVLDFCPFCGAKK